MLDKTICGRVYYMLTLFEMSSSSLSKLLSISKNTATCSLNYLLENGYIETSDRRDTIEDLLDKGKVFSKTDKASFIAHRQIPAPITRKQIRDYRRKKLKTIHPDDRSAFIRELNDYLPLIGSKKSYNRMVYYSANLTPLFDYWRLNGINVEEEKFEEFFFSDQVRDHLVDVIFNRNGKGYNQKNPVDILDVLTKFFVICLKRGLSLQVKNLDEMKPIDVMCLVLVNSIDNSKDIVDRLVEIRPTVLSSGDIAQIMYGKSPFIG